MVPRIRQPLPERLRLHFSHIEAFMTESAINETDLIVQLYKHGMIRTWYRDKPAGWVLVSGLWSPIYIQLRGLCSYPDLLKEVGRQLGGMIRAQIPTATRLVGVAMAGIPIAVSTSFAIDMPCSMTRKLEGVRTAEDFKYGEHNNIEGELSNGDEIVLIDDLVTRFDSKKVALLQIEAEAQQRGLRNVGCKAVAVLFDREQGAQRAAAEAGIRLLSVIKFLSEGLPRLESIMAKEEFAVLVEYLQTPQNFQNEEMQARLRRKTLASL